MLQRLDEWRRCFSETELADFEHRIALQCHHAISANALKTRYHSSYHRALINGKVLLEAIKTNDYIRSSSLWGNGIDAGKSLVSLLADHDGCLPVDKISSQYRKSIPTLLQRGVIFEQDKHYHLPAEMVIELRSKEKPDSWVTLVSKTPPAMLYQLVPQDAQEHMLKPKAVRNELGAWLAIRGQQTRQVNIADHLDESDWTMLLTLQHHNIDTFDELHHFCPELEPIEATYHYYYSESKRISLRKSLEKALPEQLCKLTRLGLTGINVHHGDDRYASIILCAEAKSILKPHLKNIRQRIAGKLQQQWLAEPCDAEQPSAWSMDQQVWRLWMMLHFLPVGLTQQGNLRRNELKKIAKLLGFEDVSLIEFLLFSMLRAGLIKQQDTQFVPASLNWKTWGNKLHNAIFNIVRNNHQWNKQDEKNIFALLAKLPVERWLNVDDVVSWLQMKTSDKLMDAAWMELFSDYQNYALHHFNHTHRRIYLLPEFRAVLQQSITQQAPASFTTPGWHGANKKAKTHGFISAAGEIQLPPDCNHRVLEKLAQFCSITSIEQMITLQLDKKALQRMGTNKAELKKTRSVLESLQLPLPQPVAYLFDKQQSQKPVAAAAATAMAFVLHEASAIHKLTKTGFTFSQPFKDRPEIVLLDASADADALLKSCSEAGILLDTLIKPVQWINGTASIKAWMESHVDKEDQWLEICYQKTRSSKPKQIIARIEDDYHGPIYIQATRKTRQGYALLKSTMQLQPKHVLRLRELDDAEIKELGLDKLA